MDAICRQSFRIRNFVMEPSPCSPETREYALFCDLARRQKGQGTRDQHTLSGVCVFMLRSRLSNRLPRSRQGARRDWLEDRITLNRTTHNDYIEQNNIVALTSLTSTPMRPVQGFCHVCTGIVGEIPDAVAWTAWKAIDLSGLQ